MSESTLATGVGPSQSEVALSEGVDGFNVCLMEVLDPPSFLKVKPGFPLR